MCSNILAILDEYKLLSGRQHAFRKRHSCETQLPTVINNRIKILDNEGQVGAFILDFEKAFDTPPHELLKSKLFGYGIGGKQLTWIDSFLCYTQCSPGCGERSKIGSGPGFAWCPTGHCPLPFSLCINDISTDIDSEIRLFADDSVCYREVKSTEDTLKVQKDIVQLGCWARKWGMRFQPVKCNMIQITIRDWNALPDSLISSAEGAEDGVAKLITSLVRTRD